MYNIHKLIDDIFQKKSHFLQMRRKTHPLVTKEGCSLGVKDCLMTVRRMRSGLITIDRELKVNTVKHGYRYREHAFNEMTLTTK